MHAWKLWVVLSSCVAWPAYASPSSSGPPPASSASGASSQQPTDAGLPDAHVPPIDAAVLTADASDGGWPDDDGGFDEDEDEEDNPSGDEPTVDDGEAESEEAAAGPVDGGLRFTSDITDEELRRLWHEDPAALGSISVGFADQGRIINGVHMPPGEAWTCVSPPHAWGTSETIDGLVKVLRAVYDEHPGTPPLRVNHISKQEGGYLRPHQSHQSGRDADLAFYYKRDIPPGFRGRREHLIDPVRNWALVRALITTTDTQVILVDRRIQKVLFEHALGIGEDRAWLDSIFHAGKDSMVKHARRHRDHFHVRFYSPRSQELGRRVVPLLAERPDQNIVVHRVRRGDTLGHIAMRYGTTVHAIRKANRMRNSFLRVGRTLLVPLRGPCTRCPMPPVVILPPRRLPPARADGGFDITVTNTGP